MHPDDRPKLYAAIIGGLPVFFWLAVAKSTEPLGRPKLLELLRLIRETPSKPALLAATLAGIAISVLLVIVIHKLTQSDYTGAHYRLFLRGTQVVSTSTLKRRTTERGVEQITVAGIPMPTGIEALHLLTQGSTGSGKSVLLREMVFRALCRGDRVVVVDQNGDMLSKFFRPGDVILNPYDARGEGWSFFNEVRNDYDYKRLSLSLVPRGQSKDDEEWRQYARLLLTETARKLVLVGNPSVQKLFQLCTLAKPEELQAFLAGTAAESLFVGADKALASARFVLSSKLPEHLSMPSGEFSIRAWLEQPNGNLFITWREDMTEALRPLISAWVDVLCNAVISLPESRKRRLWVFLDELASLEKLASLEDAATKGRKAGLRIVAGIQSTAQLDKVYGREEAQTLRSCFRSLVVLGGAKTDPRTSEEMSRSLGEHEVERDMRGRSHSARGNSTSEQVQRSQERVVLPSEIAALPDLEGYIAFAGNLPIAKARLDLMKFSTRVPAFRERGIFGASQETL